MSAAVSLHHSLYHMATICAIPCGATHACLQDWRKCAGRQVWQAPACTPAQRKALWSVIWRQLLADLLLFFTTTVNYRIVKSENWGAGATYTFAGKQAEDCQIPWYIQSTLS
jgi:hypothetical protein